MKKIIISLFAFIVCMSINAQTVKLYKGKLLVAEYPADQVDNVEFAPKSTKISFSASIGGDNTTRTSSTDNNNIVWDANENIDIYNTLNKTNGIFTSSEASQGQNVATFTGPNITSDLGNKYYALYPSGTKFTNSIHQMSATVPAVQPAVKGINHDYLFMTACSDNQTLKFKNVTALLKIEIKSNAFTSIGTIRIESNNGENIAGDFTAIINDNGTATITSATSSSVAIRKTADGDGTTRLDPGIYYIAVLPSALKTGFTLYFEDTSNTKIYQRVNTRVLEFERSKLYDLGTYDVDKL